MRRLYFWETWAAFPKWLVWALAILVVPLSLLYGISFFLGADAIISWFTVTRLEQVPLLIDSFAHLAWPVDLTADAFVIFRRFEAGDVQVNILAAHLIVAVFLFALSLALAMATYMTRLFFSAAMAVFMLMLALMSFDMAGLFGDHGNIAFLSITAIYSLVAFYFHSLNRKVPMPWRILAFGLLNVLLYLALEHFSEFGHASMYLASYGLAGMLILFLLFTFSISYDILNLFLYLSSASGGGDGKLGQFILISLLYFLNLTVAYLSSSGFYELDLFHLNALMVLVLSLLVGFWAARHRSALITENFRFAPFGAILYLTLAVLSLSFVSYAFLTANDPMVEVVEDIILFSHLGIGGVFFLYVLANFSHLLRRGKMVYRVVYQPTRMPFIVVRIGGLIAVIALLARANFFPYFQALAGIDNAVGDAYIVKGDDLMAEYHYRNGSQFGFHNHRSNYAMAAMAAAHGKSDIRINYLKEAISKRPTTFAYVNLGNAYLSQGSYFEAVFILQEGLGKFPENPMLHNNLGLIYEQINILDSALLSLDRADRLSEDGQVPLSNIYAFAVRRGFENEAGDLPIPQEADLGLMSNRSVFEAKTGAAVAPWPQKPIADMDADQYFRFYDSHLPNIKRLTTAQIAVVDSLANSVNGAGYLEGITFLRGLAHYYNGNKGHGIRLLEKLVHDMTYLPAYHKALVALYLHEGAYALAAAEKDLAIRRGSEEVVALTALTQSRIAISAAMQSWAQLLNAEDRDLRELARKMLKVLSITDAEFSTALTPEEQYLYITLRSIPEGADEATLRIGEMSNGNQRDAALGELAAKMLSDGDPIAARKVWDMRTEVEVTENDARATYPQLLLAESNYAELERYLNGPNDGSTAHRPFFEAALAEKAGNKTKAAEGYETLFRKDPYFTNGLRRGLDFFNMNGMTQKAYELLLPIARQNPRDVKLDELYVLQALEAGYGSYAAQGMENLQEVASPQEYERFVRIYQEKRTLMEKRADAW